MICHACMAVVWAFFLYDGLSALVPNTAVVCPTSRGVASEMSSRGFHVFGGSLLRCPYARSCFSAAQLSCLMLCFFLAVAKFPYLGEFMLCCYTMIWWYFMLLGPLREFLMRYHAFRPWWDVMRFPHDIWCFVWPPQWDCYAFTSWDFVLFLLHTFRVRLPHEMDFVMRFHIVEGSRKIVLWDVILVDPPTRFPRSLLLLFAA